MLDASSQTFTEHVGEGPFDSYLSQSVPYPPVAALLRQLEQTLAVRLKTRGEAHITVVTPVEYWNALRPLGISMSEINSRARSLEIQKAKFKVVCLGRGQAQVQGESLFTYYVVVESEQLLRIRQQVQQLVLKRGGGETDFLPGQFYPHITLGFSKRDLHESDGVKKDAQSCIAPIKIGLTRIRDIAEVKSTG